MENFARPISRIRSLTSWRTAASRSSTSIASATSCEVSVPPGTEPSDLTFGLVCQSYLTQYIIGHVKLWYSVDPGHRIAPSVPDSERPRAAGIADRTIGVSRGLPLRRISSRGAGVEPAGNGYRYDECVSDLAGGSLIRPSPSPNRRNRAGGRASISAKSAPTRTRRNRGSAIATPTAAARTGRLRAPNIPTSVLDGFYVVLSSRIIIEQYAVYERIAWWDVHDIHGPDS